MRYNDFYFDFALTPVEAEMLYRHLNARLNEGELEDHEVESLSCFRDRVHAFTHTHPCQYGYEAQGEYDILSSIARLVTELDPANAVEPRIA